MVVTQRERGTGTITSHGYKEIRVNGSRIYEHRYIWEFYYGPVPKGYNIHHVDEDKLNNAIENLEVLPHGSHSRKHQIARKLKLGTTETHKYCPACDAVKPRFEFGRHRLTPDGQRWCCRICNNKKARAYYES